MFQVKFVSRELDSQQPRLPDALLRGNGLLQGVLHAAEVLPVASSSSSIQTEKDLSTQFPYLLCAEGYSSRATAALGVKWLHIKSV